MMGKPILLLGVIFLFSFSAISQKTSTKYGNVTDDELTMTIYPQDSSANAVVLYQDVYTSYKYRESDFCLQSTHKKKIKILKTEGCDKANVVIPYYSSVRVSDRGDDITGIEAFAYNMENGKLKKEKMNKSLIFDERINDNWKQIKFSIPSVKPGTVIEYKYVHESELFQIIPDWVIQDDIPVIQARCEVLIPEFFVFNVETRGFQKIDVVEKPENETFSVKLQGSNYTNVPSNSRGLHFSVQNVPALKNEPFVWCPKDYISRVIFELHGTNFGVYKPFTKSWKEIEELLAKDSNFGDKLKMTNPFREELQAIIAGNPDEQSKIAAIYTMVKSKIKWDGKYRFYGDQVKDAIKNGLGNNADINFVLISAFRDAGIKAFPVLLSRRDVGRLPITYPSLNSLNTFIVGIQTSDNKKLYIDGSVVHGNVNVLPLPLLVDRAREYQASDVNEWVNLTGISTSRVNMVVEADVAPDGNVAGKCQTAYSGQMAYAYKENRASSKDSLDFKERRQSEMNAGIASLTVDGADSLSSNVKESLIFGKKMAMNDNYIYLSPILFPHISKNPFTQEERMLPIEFSYPYQFRSIYILNLPEGYKVEELPKPLQLVLLDNACVCSYSVLQQENQISINYVFSLNRVLFSQLEYPDLRKAWEMLVAKNTEQIVLKKI